MRMALPEAATNGHVTEPPVGAVTIASLLPAVYRDYDPNIVRFTAGLDAVLTPVWMAMDCFASYLDPQLSPEDMLGWLAGWVGVVVDDNWHPDQLRRLVARSAELYRSRGTVQGITDLVEAYTGLRPEVFDGGTVTVSGTPDSAPGGTADAVVRVRVTGAGLDMEALQRLRRFLLAAIPAHMTIRLEAT